MLTYYVIFLKRELLQNNKKISTLDLKKFSVNFWLLILRIIYDKMKYKEIGVSLLVIFIHNTYLQTSSHLRHLYKIL